MNRPNLCKVIADFNEKHGVSGVQVDRHQYSNEQLRSMKMSDIDAIALWAAAYKDHKVKRPKGKAVYVVTGRVATAYFGYRRIQRIEVTRITEHGPDNTTDISYADAKRMEVVT